MAPRGRKTSIALRSQRHSTQFGELETTPTSQRFQSAKDIDGHSSNLKPISQFLPLSGPLQPPRSTNEFDDDLDDLDLLNLDPNENKNARTTHGNTFEWSEAGSVTRRSTPVPVGETPDVRWQFDDGDSLGSLGSPKSGVDNLPDTAPLPSSHILVPALEPPAQAERAVDFSETASTMRRSSPYGHDDTAEAWDFAALGSSVHGSTGALPETTLLPQLSSPHHCPIDDIYDATPPRTASQNAANGKNTKVATKPPGMHGPTPPKTAERGDDMPSLSAIQRNSISRKHSAPFELNEDLVSLAPRKKKQRVISMEMREEVGIDGPKTDEPPQILSSISPTVPSASQNAHNSKKRKQRAKAPLEFDEATQEIKDALPEKKVAQPARMPIVTRLRDSVHSFNSPATAPPKRPARKAAQPKKESKIAQPKKPKAAKTKQVRAAQPKQTEAFTLRQVKTARAVESDAQAEPLPIPPTVTHVEPAARSANHFGRPKQPIEEGPAQKPAALSKSKKKLAQAERTFEIDPMFLSSDPASDTADGTFVPLSSSMPNGDQPLTTSLDAPSPPMPSLRSQAPRPALTSARGLREQPSVMPSKPPAPVSNVPQTIESANPVASPAVNGHSSAPLKVPSARKTHVGDKKQPTDLRKTLTTKAAVLEDTPAQARSGASNGLKKPSVAKLGRRVSISDRGSPLRTQDTSVPSGSLAHIETSNETYTPDTEVTSLSHLSGTRLFQTEQAPAPSMKTGGGIGSARILQPLPRESNRPAGDARVHVRAVSTKRAKNAPQPTGQQARDPRGVAISDKLRAQILASFQKPEETSGRLVLQAQPSPQSTRSPPELATGIGKQLHQIVDIMLKNLSSKETPVQRVPEVYRSRTLDTVGQIEHRFVDERDTLLQKCKEDGLHFSQTVNKARSVVEDGHNRRDAEITLLEETLARRRLQYERAMVSLRGMHRQLLDGDFDGGNVY